VLQASKFITVESTSSSSTVPRPSMISFLAVTDRLLSANFIFFYFFLFIEGSRSRCYGRTAALKAYCATLWWRWGFFCFPILMEHRCNEIDRGKPNYSGGKPVPVPLCPPQAPHGPTRDRAWTSAVRGRRLIAWAMARPKLYLNVLQSSQRVWTVYNKRKVLIWNIAFIDLMYVFTELQLSEEQTTMP
jgi:hypothetical protein